MRFDIDLSCANAGKTHSKSFSEFITVVKNMPETPFSTMIKSAVCYQVRYATEKILDENNDPAVKFAEILEQNTKILSCVGQESNVSFTSLIRENFDSIESNVGSHYGNLFKEFDDDHYFNETTKLLKTRLERNNFSFESISEKIALDCGCGGGRYTAALKSIGFKNVIGIDVSEIGIQDARKRIKDNNIRDVTFEVASALKLPFKNDMFDFVFSNGVLHHTTSIEDGISELIRVLKKGGIGWLYLINNPGGIFWDMVDALRFLMKDVPKDFAISAFATMGVPSNKIFHILDHIMVPINVRLTDKEIRTLLSRYGAINIRRLERGTDFDFTERIYHNVPFATEKYGSGEHRYFFSK